MPSPLPPPPSPTPDSPSPPAPKESPIASPHIESTVRPRSWGSVESSASGVAIVEHEPVRRAPHRALGDIPKRDIGAARREHVELLLDRAPRRRDRIEA